MRLSVLILLTIFSFGRMAGAKDVAFASLENPQFIATHGEKLVFVHTGGVAEVEATTEALSAAGLAQAPVVEKAKSVAFIESLRHRTQSWLQKVQMVGQKDQEARQAAALAAARSVEAPTNTTQINQPTEPKAPKSFFQAEELVAEFDPEVHSGRYFRVSGTVTRILEPQKGTFHIVLNDKVVVVARYLNEKVKARDTSGNPRIVGDYIIGESATFMANCKGLDTSGRVLMEF